MPLSRLVRPVSVGVFAYVFILSALHRSGAFAVAVAPGWEYFFYKTGAEIEGKIVSGSFHKRAGERYWAVLRRAQGRSLPEAKALVYVSRKSAQCAPFPGDRVLFIGKLRPGRWPRIPGDFDETAFLELNGASLVLHAKDCRTLEASAGVFRVAGWGERFHRSFREYLMSNLGRDAAGVIEGIMIGCPGKLAPSTKKQIQAGGLMHLLTPSGAKITLVFVFAYACFSAAALGPLWRLTLSVAACGASLPVVGFSPPHARAFLMIAVASAAWSLGRGKDVFQAWILSGGLILLFDPRQLMSAGFVLTYGAMFGIIFLLPRLPAPNRAGPGFRAVWTAFSICAVIQAMLWPAFAAFFESGSLAGIFLNAVWVPLSPLISGLGAVAWAAAETGWERVSLAVLRAAAWFAEGLIASCRWVSASKWASVELGAFTPWETGAYYSFIAALFSLPDFRRAAKAAFLAGAFLLVQAYADRSGPLKVCVLPGEGEPFSVGRGRIRIERGSEGARVLSGDKVEYCIITSSTSSRRRCRYSRTLDTRREGAVWITTDGQKYSIETQKERYSRGRPLS